jgi:hypothetical protein
MTSRWLLALWFWFDDRDSQATTGCAGGIVQPILAFSRSAIIVRTGSRTTWTTHPWSTAHGLRFAS